MLHRTPLLTGIAATALVCTIVLAGCSDDGTYIPELHHGTSSAALPDEAQNAPVREVTVAVYGASLGGTSAALTLGDRGVQTLLISDDAHIGGQAVSAGLSAFDDDKRPWEKSGILQELWDFLAEKYDQDGKRVGTGRATVGLLATMPSDVEAFFEHRLNELQTTVSVLRSHTLIAVERSADNRRVDRILLRENDGAGAYVWIRATSFVDGTETGRLFEKSGVPQTIGFDTKEDTGEEHAMPATVRQSFIDGFDTGYGPVGGFGNLVQAVGVPFGIVDRGIPGPFFQAIPVMPDCWEPSDTEPFVNTGRTWRSTASGCEAQVALTVESVDTYDLYAITHRARGVEGSIDIGGTAYGFQTYGNPEDTLTFLTRATLSPEKTTIVTLRSDSPNAVAEGIIAVPRHLHQAAYDLTGPFGSTPVHVTNNAGPLAADVLLSSDEAFLPELSFVLAGTTYTATRIAADTWRTEDVLLHGNRNDLLLPASVRRATIIPVAFVTTGSMLLRPEDATVRDRSGETREEIAERRVWEWHVQPPATGDIAFFLTDWPRFAEATIRVTDESTGKLIDRGYLTNAVATGAKDTPLFIRNLKAGQSYRIEFGTNEELNTAPTIRLDAASQFLTARGRDKASLSGNTRPGIYDLWVRATSPTRITSINGQETMTMDASSAVFQHLGKTFLGYGSHVEFAASADFLVLAIRNDRVPLTVHPFDASVDGTTVVLRLPPGHYRLRLQSKERSAKPQAELRQNGQTAIAHIDAEGNLLSASGSSFLSDGSPLTIALRGIRGASTLVAYDAIPPEKRSAFRTQFPLLTDADPDDGTISFFNYRNVMTGDRVFAGQLPEPSPTPIARNSLGGSIVLLPFSDYAPVPVERIDDPGLTADARSFAYAYWYWLRYESERTPEETGCDAAQDPLCNPLRLALAPGIMRTRDGFAERQYVREGRRLVTPSPLSETDVTPHERSFDNDAIAAVSYAIDFHAFIPIRDSVAGALKNFLAAMRREKFLRTDEETLFETVIEHAATSITLGSVVSDNVDNVLPASINFGTTQIANASLRVHTVEMALGRAIGHIIGFTIEQGVSVRSLQDDPERLQALQRDLIVRGVSIYPIDDRSDDPDALRAAQFGVLKGVVDVMPYVDGKTQRWIIGLDRIAAADDLPLIERLTGLTHLPTYGEFLPRVLATLGVSTPGEDMVQRAFQLQLLDAKILRFKPAEILQVPVSREALLRAFFRIEHPGA